MTVPADGTYRAGETVNYHVRRIDAAGRVVDVLEDGGATLELPPCAQAAGAGQWLAARPGVGVLRATADGLGGAARLRVVPALASSAAANDSATKDFPDPGSPKIEKDNTPFFLSESWR